MSTPKPAVPVLNPASLFTANLIVCVPFTEGSGIPAVLVGPSGSGTPVFGNVPTPTWTTNSDGAAWLATGAAAQVTLTAGQAASANMTVALVLRPRAANSSGRIVALLNGDLFCYTPFSDTVVYWDFGGTSAPNRLTKSGLTFLQVPTTYVFTGGSAGSTIWQNGTKVASQATALTRNAGGGVTFVLNADGGTFDVNLVSLYNTAWDDATAAAWSADPYANLVLASGGLPMVGVG